jgi:hypothetical protein
MNIATMDRMALLLEEKYYPKEPKEPKKLKRLNYPKDPMKLKVTFDYM